MDKEKELPEDFQIKINFRIAGRMPSVYAHHMLVQQGEDEVILSFFEIVAPPFIGGPTEEQLVALKEGGVVAECVSRVTVSKNKFLGFAQAIQQVADAMKALSDTGTEGATNANDS